MWRARGFVLRDLFGDVLRGFKTVEELWDMDANNDVEPTPAPPAVVNPEPTPPIPGPVDMVAYWIRRFDAAETLGCLEVEGLACAKAPSAIKVKLRDAYAKALARLQKAATAEISPPPEVESAT